MHAVEDSDVYGGFCSFRDKAIQERLLEADDEIVAQEILRKEILISRWQKNGFHNYNNDGTHSNVSDNGGKNNGNVQKCKDFRVAPFCGWRVDPNITYRKTENGGSSKSKVAAGSMTKDAPLARDSKSKTFSSEDFVFEHYLDTSCYIEQYRKQHACSDTITLSPARSDLSDLRKPQIHQQYSPMTVCSHINFFQQDTSLASSQLDGLQGAQAQNSDKQNHTQNKQQVTTTQFANKRDQQRQKFHSKLKNSKKTYSPPTSTYDMSKVMGMSDSAPTSGQFERICSAKELVLIPAISDIPVLKTAATVMKIHTLNINSLPAKHIRLPKSGPILDPVTGSHLLGHRLGFSVTNQTKMLDATAFRLAGGSGKQSSGSQEVTRCSDTHLEPFAMANERDLISKPAQLFMTDMRKEECLQTQGPDLNGKVQVLPPLAMKSSRSDILRNGIEMVGLANSFQQKVDEKHLLRSDKIPKQNLPGKESSLLTVTGLDCMKTRKFVCDHLASSRKQDGKQLLSHKRRIRHLVEQSKLKCKFDQILNMSKVPSKTFLEIKSIQITDPFVKAVPYSSQNSNNNWDVGQNASCDVCSCFVDCKKNNNVSKYNRKTNSMQNKSPVNCVETSVQDRVEEFDSISSYSDLTQSNIDMGSPLQVCEDLVTSTAGLEDLYLPKHSYTDSVGVLTQSAEGLFAACGTALEVHLPKKNKPKQACSNKCYIHRLVEDVSKMKVTVPELREFPFVCKSHSLDL